MVQGSYTTPFVPFFSFCQRDGALGCVAVETRKNEAFLTARVRDAHGHPVLITVSGPDPDRGPEWSVGYGTFCGKTEEPIAIPRGRDVYFRIGSLGAIGLQASLTSCPPMLGTTGTVSVTLSNLP
jgi:hypothetical protein